MPTRLVALDEGPDIPLDRAMVVVGRHPECDSRLESLRVSRHHCCMTPESGDLLVRDLGSTNGIRINGQRVSNGRLKSGDELSIAHLRYRYERSEMVEHTHAGLEVAQAPSSPGALGDAVKVTDSDPGIFAEAVRKLLPAAVADRCKIQVIVRMAGDSEAGRPDQALPEASPALENAAECHSDLSR